MPSIFMFGLLALIPAGLLMAWFDEEIKKRKAEDPDWTAQKGLMRWGNERSGPLMRKEVSGEEPTRRSAIDSNSFVIRMAEAIHRYRLEDEGEFDDGPDQFQMMMDIRTEYWRHANVGPGRGRTDRINDRLEKMVRDELERSNREIEADEAAREKAKIEDASILKDGGIQAIVDFAPEGGLVRISTVHHGAVHFLRVHNGTVNPDGSREEYAICVPRECRTVKAALAWTYGIEPDNYAEVIRT